MCTDYASASGSSAGVSSHVQASVLLLLLLFQYRLLQGKTRVSSASSLLSFLRAVSRLETIRPASYVVTLKVQTSYQDSAGINASRDEKQIRRHLGIGKRTWQSKLFRRLSGVDSVFLRRGRHSALTASSSELTRTASTPHVSVFTPRSPACSPARSHHANDPRHTGRLQEDEIRVTTKTSSHVFPPSLLVWGTSPHAGLAAQPSHGAPRAPPAPPPALTRMLFTMAAVLLSAASGFPMRKSQAQNTRQQKA